jgi:hypothetical protein
MVLEIDEINKENETDALIFVEDPGAANFVAPLPEALASRGWRTSVFAAGLAKDYLANRQVAIQVIDHSMTAELILSTNKPRILIAGTAENKDTIGLTLISMARDLGIITIGIIDAIMNAQYRFRGQCDIPLAHAPDWLLVPDEWTKQVFVTLGFSETHAVVCGHPHYDYVIDKIKEFSAMNRDVLKNHLFPGLRAGQKIIVFVTEGSARVKKFSPPPLHEYTITGRGNGAGRTEIVMEEFLDAVKSLSSRPYLVLRLHPKETSEDYLQYLEEFDLVDNKSAPLELVYGADLVVGMTSMLLMEAALLGRPTLSILPRPQEGEWLHSIKAGVTQCVTNREALKKVMGKLIEEREALQKKDRPEFVSYGSLERTVSFIEGLLTEKNMPASH